MYHQIIQCGSCGEHVACNAFSVKCGGCGAWSHGDCVVETEAERAALRAGAEEGREFSWQCRKCPKG